MPNSHPHPDGLPSARRRTILAALPLLAVGCFSSARTLHGFPDFGKGDPREVADRMTRALRATEAGIAAAHERGVGGTDQFCEMLGELRVLDAYVSLASDGLAPATGLEPQGTSARRLPLFLYPRATCPHIAEASHAADGSGLEWVLPVLLHRESFLVPSRFSPVLGDALSALVLPRPDMVLPEAGPPLLDELRRRVHFALVPRDPEHREPISLDDEARPFLQFVDANLSDEGRFCSAEDPDVVVGPRLDALELVARIPASVVLQRWSDLAGSALHGERPREELFDLRIFPRVPVEVPLPAGAFGRAVAALGAGRWVLAAEFLEESIRGLSDPRVAALEPGPTAECAAALSDSLARVAGELPIFAPDLAPVEDRARRLARALASEDAPPEEIASRVRDLEKAVRRVVSEDPCPAPFLLDEPEPADRSFSFVVGADLQYDSDGSNLAGFLSLIDPASLPESSMERREIPSIPRELEEEIRGAKFVVIVGDFGDGKGLSSSGLAPVADAFGLSAPKSPYARVDDPTAGEFPQLREQIRRSSKAIFAVPGNHDGFAAYGGLPNQLFAGLGYLLRTLPLLGAAGDWLVDDLSGGLPTLVRLLRFTPPFYDGLVDWAYELGPRNVAFHYRGCAVVALNSFDLHQVERDQVGALGNNWGGGLQDASLVWFDVALRHFAGLDRRARRLEPTPAHGKSFVLMHHDPRAGLASKTGYRETRFGRYNDVTSPMNELTFGWLGLGWASYTGIFLPVISPITNDVLREAVYGQDFQERWMRKNAWDEDCYNARGLIEAINRNLDGVPEGAPEPPARISHLFFGHDDTPVVDRWVSAEGRAVFPNAHTDGGWGSVGHHVVGALSRSQSSGPPAWANAMTFDDGRNAAVIRMDDLGDLFSSANTHGFHLVSVTYADGAAEPSVRVRRIHIPR